MEKLITAKGQEFYVDDVIVSPASSIAYIRVVNAKMSDIATVFSDKSHTICMTWNELIWYGYTKLVAIIPEGNAIKIALEKE